jgi:hypothetical protein
MVDTSRALGFFPLFTLLSAAALAGGCAHKAAPPSLTSAQAQVAPAPASPPAAVEAPKVEPTTPATPTTEEAAPKPKKAQPQALSFEQLSAQLGSEDKMALDTDSLGGGSTVAPEGKGLSANGYAAVGATHQAVPETVDSRGGEVKVSGGITVAQVRGTVHDANARLRHCYERGLQNAPHLAGNVKVMLTIDAKGAVSDADSESDTLPGEVTSCVVEVFSSMSFPAPKQPPAKVVYPIEFRKE